MESKLRPRSGSSLPIPVNFKNLRLRNKKSIVITVVSLLVLNFFTSTYLHFQILPFISHGNRQSSVSKLLSSELVYPPPVHGLYKHEIEVSSPLIYPSVEHAPLLRELGVEKLFRVKIDPKIQSRTLVFDDDEEIMAENEIKESSMQEDSNPLTKLKKNFKNHGKKVFKGSKSPELVIVTGLDFEKNELSYLTKIGQNRVDYAQRQNYGVYIRWLQEFSPLLEDYQNELNKKWVKLMMMRLAIHLFPELRYFWYLDQDSLIMNQDIDIITYMLTPDLLDPIIIKEQPIIPPNGLIKTYKTTTSDDVSLILTQSENKIETSSFILINDIYGKSLLEFWSNPLFRQYSNFPLKDESAISHILQWHPVLLSKTAIVPIRTMNSIHSALELSNKVDKLHYQLGDLVVTFKGCDEQGNCDEILNGYWQRIKKQ